MKHVKKLIAVVGLSGAMVMSAAQAQQTVEIKFSAQVNGQPFSCGQSYKV